MRLLRGAGVLEFHIAVTLSNAQGLNPDELRKQLTERGPESIDTTVAGWYSISLVRALLTCRRHRIPMLYRGDTHRGMRPRGIRGLLWRVKTRLLLGQFSAHLAVGRRAREYLLSFGVPPSRGL